MGVSAVADGRGAEESGCWRRVERWRWLFFGRLEKTRNGVKEKGFSVEDSEFAVEGLE